MEFALQTQAEADFVLLSPFRCRPAPPRMPVHSGLCREAPGASSGPAANSGLLDPSHFGVSVKRLLPVVASYFPTRLVLTNVTMPVAGGAITVVMILKALQCLSSDSYTA